MSFLRKTFTVGIGLYDRPNYKVGDKLTFCRDKRTGDFVKKEDLVLPYGRTFLYNKNYAHKLLLCSEPIDNYSDILSDEITVTVLSVNHWELLVSIDDLRIPNTTPKDKFTILFQTACTCITGDKIEFSKTTLNNQSVFVSNNGSCIFATENSQLLSNTSMMTEHMYKCLPDNLIATVLDVSTITVDGKNVKAAVVSIDALLSKTVNIVINRELAKRALMVVGYAIKEINSLTDDELINAVLESLTTYGTDFYDA